MKVRVKFGKDGSARFAGHLDVMRYFQKALRRAEVPMVYTHGFSPHPVMSFAQPLGLGLSSEGEYFDLEVSESLTTPEEVARLQAQMAEGFSVTDWRLLPEKSQPAMAVIAAADYAVSIRQGHEKPAGIFSDLPGAIARFRAQEKCLVTRETKKNTIETDLLPLIYEMRPDEADPETVFLRVSAGSVDNVRPEVVMEAFWRFAGCEPAPFDFAVRRLELYARAEDGSFITLADMGVPVTEQLSDAPTEGEA